MKRKLDQNDIIHMVCCIDIFISTAHDDDAIWSQFKLNHRVIAIWINIHFIGAPMQNDKYVWISLCKPAPTRCYWKRI